MEHLFLNKKLSQIAKDKGFDEPCLGFYNTDGYFFIRTEDNLSYVDDKPADRNSIIPADWGIFAAPLYQQIIDWFESVHHIRVCPIPYTSGAKKYQIWIWNSERVLWEDTWKRIDNQDIAIEEAFKLIT